MPICAILLAKPSMQVLYERVLRRPYPRSQRHVYIGMSWPLQYLNSTCLSLLFPLNSSFLLVENTMSSLCPTFQRHYLNCCHAIFSIMYILNLSFHLFITRHWSKNLITQWFCRICSLWSCHIKSIFWHQCCLTPLPYSACFTGFLKKKNFCIIK